MKPSEIRGRLQIAGYTSQGQLADELGVTESAVNRVINGTLTSRRIMEAIAAKIKRVPRRVFPRHAHLFAGPKVSRINPNAQST